MEALRAHRWQSTESIPFVDRRRFDESKGLVIRSTVKNVENTKVRIEDGQQRRDVREESNADIVNVTFARMSRQRIATDLQTQLFIGETFEND